MQTIEAERINKQIEELKEKYGNDNSALLPILQAFKQKYGTLSGYLLQEIAHSLGVHPVEVQGVASFYSFF